MNKTQPKSSGSSSLLLFFAFLIGGIIGFLAFKADAKPTEKERKLSKEYARVETMQDLYVFIESVPATDDGFESLGTFECTGDTTVGAKETVAQALCRLFYSTKDTLPFDQRLSMMISNVKTNFPEANGVVFSDKMKKCNVIKFKEQE
jgi:hypothetical protein